MAGDVNGSATTAIMMNYPMWLYTGAAFSLFPADVNPSYVRASDLYSEYRVTGIALHWVPRYSDNPVGGGGAGNESWIATNPNAANVTEDVQEAVNSPGFKQFGTTSQFRTYLPNTWCKGWFYTGAAPNDSISSGTQTPPNPLGSIALQHYGAIASTVLGYWMITYYVKFRGIDGSQVDPNQAQVQEGFYVAGEMQEEKEEKEEKKEILHNITEQREQGRNRLREHALAEHRKRIEEAKAAEAAKALKQLQVTAPPPSPLKRQHAVAK